MLEITRRDRQHVHLLATLEFLQKNFAAVAKTDRIAKLVRPCCTWLIATGALPLGLGIDPNSGAITGTPNTAGPSTFTVQATDVNSIVGAQKFTININPQLQAQLEGWPRGNRASPTLQPP